jgi:hypothetical protein
VTVHYFPIRHHGPGSAASLVGALDELRPAAVLIEGPADAGELLPALASDQMKPPIALLCYKKDDPSLAAFWPFAEYSPEYQAALWALRNGAQAKFIDLPSAAAIGHDAEEAGRDEAGDDNEDGDDDGEPPGADQAGPETDGASGGRDAGRPLDPIGRLAEAAGYEDGESWWCDLLDQNPAPGPVFGAVAEAMGELRTDVELDPFEAKREAHMRLRVAEAARVADGPVAVVCGAWHVPALAAKVPAAADRKTLAGLPRVKSAVTWAPWAEARLASGTGYGAGVRAPGWNLHVWRTWGREESNAIWLTRIARLLRERGHDISPASLIEAERLALALAALRDRPRAGFEELREASVACLFGGDDLLWRLLEKELLLGDQVGEVPPDTEAAPLVKDVRRIQREVRLKPEAMERELALDLRSESGRKRSLLLHRLGALEVPWGELLDAGRSRGTFRENWRLRWEPEFTVALVERVVWGSDLEGAASAYLTHQMGRAGSLDALAQAVGDAVAAELSEAWTQGLRLLEAKAALTSDVGQLLAAVAPLAATVRYGQARQVDTEPLRALAERLAVEAALGLRHAARGLDDAAAGSLAAGLRGADQGLRLLEAGPETMAVWFAALEELVDDSAAAAFAAGCAGQLLYTAERVTPAQAVALLERRLSPGTEVAWAARFLEGFFTSQAARLIYDTPLRVAVDQWLRGISAEDFLGHLPLFRRVLSELDSMERKRLFEAVVRGSGPARLAGAVVLPADVWAAHLRAVAPLLAGAQEGGPDE